jgi:hypothetical protein
MASGRTAESSATQIDEIKNAKTSRELDAVQRLRSRECRGGIGCAVIDHWGSCEGHLEASGMSARARAGSSARSSATRKSTPHSVILTLTHTRTKPRHHISHPPSHLARFHPPSHVKLSIPSPPPSLQINATKPTCHPKARATSPRRRRSWWTRPLV